MIRRGRNEFLDGGEFATIPLAGLADALRIGDGETIEDVRRRLDPERITHVLGVTEDGRIDGAIVPTYGEKLLTNGQLGVDLLVVPPGAGFPVHVHQGHHLLLVIAGRGTFSLDHEIHEVAPGDLSMIEGMVPHAVGNPFDQPHCLLAIGAGGQNDLKVGHTRSPMFTKYGSFSPNGENFRLSMRQKRRSLRR